MKRQLTQKNEKIDRKRTSWFSEVIKKSVHYYLREG